MSGSTPITLITTLTHIYLGDEKIATFQSQTDDTPKTTDDDKLVFHISDHLNSSSLDLSSTGIILQATDYQPFGKTITYSVTNTRVKGKKGGYTNKYKFANKQDDTESDLQYFEKRYYDNRIGRFTTEDLVFWEVGLTKRPGQYFTDPQQWNSYSYVRNNPINLVDPTGEIAGETTPIEDVFWVGGMVLRGYYEMAKFIAVEGAIAMGSVGVIVAQNQALVDVASSTQQGSTSPAPNSPNLGNGPAGKPPQKPDKPTKDQVNKAVDANFSKNHANADNRLTKDGLFKNADSLKYFMKNQATKNLSNLKDGMNGIQVKVSNQIVTVRINISNGTIQSINAFPGASNRAGVNIINSTK